MHQTLRDSPPLTMGPGVCTCRPQQRPISELEDRLPNHLKLAGGHNVGAGLGSWPEVTHRFLDNNPNRYSGKGFCGNASRNPGLMVGEALSLFCTTRWRRRGSMVPNLGLLRLSRRSRARQKCSAVSFFLVTIPASCSPSATSRLATWA